MKKLLSVLLATSVLLTQGNFGYCACDVNSGKNEAQCETASVTNKESKDSQKTRLNPNVVFVSAAAALAAVVSVLGSTAIHEYAQSQRPNGFQNFYSATGDALQGAIIWPFTSLWSVGTYALGKAWNGVTYGVGKAWNGTTDWFTNTSVYNHNYTKDWESVKSAPSSVKDWFTNTSVYNHNYTQDWESIKSAPSALWNGSKNTFISFLDLVVTAVLNLFHSGANNISDSDVAGTGAEAQTADNVNIGN